MAIGHNKSWAVTGRTGSVAGPVDQHKSWVATGRTGSVARPVGQPNIDVQILWLAQWASQILIAGPEGQQKFADLEMKPQLSHNKSWAATGRTGSVAAPVDQHKSWAATGHTGSVLAQWASQILMHGSCG